MSRRVLVVDDEKLIVKGIRFSLEQDGYDVDCAYDGEEALKLAKENAYDIILLDVMLPKYDGFEVCQQIREYSDVPIIMLTAKGDDMDKILGLDYGADDYITKPFNILEVKARIKAIMRRVSKRDKNQENEKVIVKGEMKIDCESRRVIIGEKEINLTAKEFDLLELLAMNPGKVYSRENLLNIVWGYEYPGDVRTVDVHIRRLRVAAEAGNEHHVERIEDEDAQRNHEQIQPAARQRLFQLAAAQAGDRAQQQEQRRKRHPDRPVGFHRQPAKHLHQAVARLPAVEEGVELRQQRVVLDVPADQQIHLPGERIVNCPHERRYAEPRDQRKHAGGRIQPVGRLGQIRARQFQRLVARAQQQHQRCIVPFQPGGLTEGLRRAAGASRSPGRRPTCPRCGRRHAAGNPARCGGRFPSP